MARMMAKATVSCLICDSGRLELLYQGVRDHFGIATDAYSFLRCKECGSATLDPLPASHTLPLLYPPDYTFKADEPDQSTLRRLLRAVEWHAFYRPVYQQRLNTFRRLTGLASGLILEVGCGNGLFLRLLARAGYDAEGMDISEADVAYARDQLALRVFHGTLEDLTFAADRYDAVLLVSVLEHVPDPPDTVRQVFRILRPGGWIVVSVPVIDSWQAKLLGPRWGAVTEAPRHLMIPSCAGVGRLLTAAGFSDVRSAPMPVADNAGLIALSLLPGAATPRSYGRAGSFTLVLRRAAGALLILPALLVALAERVPGVSGPRSGTMMFCARK